MCFFKRKSNVLLIILISCFSSLFFQKIEAVTCTDVYGIAEAKNYCDEPPKSELCASGYECINQGWPYASGCVHKTSTWIWGCQHSITGLACANGTATFNDCLPICHAPTYGSNGVANSLIKYCDIGTVSNFSQSGKNYTWNCTANNTISRMADKTLVSCSFPIAKCVGAICNQWGVCNNGYQVCSSYTKTPDNCSGEVLTPQRECSVQINGICGSTHYNCNAGTSINNLQGGAGWAWQCQGSGGGTTATCSENFSTCTWTCGTWEACQPGNVQYRSCSSSPSGCTGGNPYGTSQSCQYSNPVNGNCSSYHYNCNSGTSINNLQGGAGWAWHCQGSGGGTAATCSENFPTCNYSYGSWSVCSNGTQTRTATATNSPCTGTPIISQSCTSTCIWTCGAWGACQSNNIQTRTCSYSPSGCTGSNPYPTTQNCYAVGACGSTHYNCASGVPGDSYGDSGCNDGTIHTWSWNCNDVKCYEYKPICGTANGNSFTSLDSSTSNLCFTCHETQQFAPADFKETSTGWTWTCRSPYDSGCNNNICVISSPVNCSANKIARASCSYASPDNVNVNGATHDVYAYGVANASAVYFAVWSTANAQDDIWWYAGTNLGGGTWKATIDFALHHNNEEGQYNTHAYVVDGTGFIYCNDANFVRLIPVNGVCGNAARVYEYNITSYSGYSQCYSGSPNTTAFPASGSSVSWTCSGTNGGSVSGTCTASRAVTPVAGACGTANNKTYNYNETSYGTDTQCAPGTPSTTAFPAQGSIVIWTCSGSGGGETRSCAAGRNPAPVNGLCGTANLKTYPYNATGYGLDTQCAPGTPSNTAFPAVGGITSWYCAGSNGGSNSQLCAASRVDAPINGVCGSANLKTYPYDATGYGLDTQCAPGTPSNTAFPVQGSRVDWTCSGSGGGTSSSCFTSRNIAKSDKEITSFQIKITYPDTTTKNFIGIIDNANYKITVTLPYGTDLTNLTAIFEHTGERVQIDSVVQVSNVTKNDFTNKLIYTVYAQNDSSQPYEVTVKNSLNPNWITEK
ncbi:MAG: GBS Bsp-like repeat-containing protein [Candidatus Pacebacteria bacterium]|nr:GBS Bsp-like repeat-containing protein [Candidatus Paceibacterota bacterium]